MKFLPTKINGAFVIDIEKKEDDRGFFARAFCADEFKKAGLESTFVQTNMSFNYKKGTIRGLHFQNDPYGETKLMRCINGSIYDVIVDLRKDSPSYLQWFGIELSAKNARMLYTPKGCAHGYQALTDGAVALYSSTEYYTSGAEGGVRYDDPKLNIDWPVMNEIIVSEKDKNLPLL